jgi:hypothetical protein
MLTVGKNCIPNRFAGTIKRITDLRPGLLDSITFTVHAVRGPVDVKSLQQLFVGKSQKLRCVVWITSKSGVMVNKHDLTATSMIALRASDD